MKNAKPLRKLLGGVFICIAVFVSVTYIVDHFGDGVNTESLSAALAAVNESDPASDVTKHIQDGDMSYVGLMGFGLHFPGLPAKQPQPSNYRVLDGTSDAVESRFHNRLLDRAYRYASKYNSELHARLTTNTNQDFPIK